MSTLSPSTILIVTGAHLAAEASDRPLAYYLREQIGLVRAGEAGALVCSDLWYLNHAELRECATVSIGGPTVSALAAYLAPRLPSVLAVDGVYMVQMDVEGERPVASCWGSDEDGTAAAVQAFVERHMEEFLEACGVG